MEVLALFGKVAKILCHKNLVYAKFQWILGIQSRFRDIQYHRACETAHWLHLVKGALRNPENWQILSVTHEALKWGNNGELSCFIQKTRVKIHHCHANHFSLLWRERSKVFKSIYVPIRSFNCFSVGLGWHLTPQSCQGSWGGRRAVWLLPSSLWRSPPAGANCSQLAPSHKGPGTHLAHLVM